MLETRMPSSPADSEQQADKEECIFKQLSPYQCLDLIQRRSGSQLGGGSSDRRSLVILDVRTAQEYSSGHLKGAINLDFRSPSFADELASLNRDNAYLVYCRTGVRSGRTAALMRVLGFREVYDLSGGVVGWLSEGFEVVSDYF